jgi:hypothetical protein
MSQHQVRKSQIYSLWAYMPFAFVASHLLFAAQGRTKLAYPLTQGDKRQQTLKAKNLISSMIADMSPVARAFASSTNLVSGESPLTVN